MPKSSSVVLVEPYYLPISHTMGYFQRILTELRRAGYTVDGHVVTDATTSADAHSELSFAVHRMRFFNRSATLRRLCMFAAALWLASRGVKQRRDKALVLLAYEAIFVWLARPFLGYPRIVLIDHSCDYGAGGIRGLKGRYKALSRPFVRRLARDPRVQFVVHSTFHRDKLLQVIGDVSDRVTIIEYGCDLRPTPYRGARDGRVHVLLPGIWRCDKGLEFALTHFPAELLRQNYELVVAGYPQELSEEQLRAIAESRGVSASVRLIPRFLTEEELAREYASAAYVIYPYAPWYTGGRGPVKDAAGHGRPVLSSTAAGLEALVCAEGYGLVFTAGDPADFAAKVRDMDRKLRDGSLGALAERAAQYAKSIAWPSFARRLGEVALA